MSEKIPTFKALKARAERMRGTFSWCPAGWIYLDIPNPHNEDELHNSCSGTSIAAVAAFLDVIEREAK